MEFNWRPMAWTCNCGETVDEVIVGISSMAEIITSWQCPNCNKKVMARLPLEQILRDLPPPPEPEAQLSLEWTEFDRSLLGGMNISMEGEGI